MIAVVARFWEQHETWHESAGYVSLQLLRLADLIADSMTGTPLEWEVDIRREAVATAKKGCNFTSGNFPSDLAAEIV